MMKQMIEFYHSNADFKRFVDMNAASYNKDVNFVLAMPITWEYFESLQKGGCNERHRPQDNK